MDEAKDLMAVCIAILNRVYEVYVDDNETDTENLKLRSDDAKLNEAAGNDKHLLKGAITLLDFLSPNPFHSVYPLENDSSGWEAHLNSYFIEKLEGITIIDDYLKVQDEVREKSFPNQQNNGTQVESTKQVKVFIAMPFKEDWSNDVKNAIYKVADQINQDYGERIICKRADEIVEGGSITSQIEEEIKNCDYMIADVTRYNGNVMWELGYYCREQSKPIILNQNIDGSPFDVRHYRQIEYSVDALENLRDDLRKYMKKMLKLDQ
jgi:nucleoside 2-deoxyribosyltransferase